MKSSMLMKIDHAEADGSAEATWQLLSAATKFVDLVDEKVKGSRPDNKIQSPRSPRSAPIDKGLTRQMS
jgi:hypothetical protein